MTTTNNEKIVPGGVEVEDEDAHAFPCLQRRLQLTGNRFVLR